MRILDSEKRNAMFAIYAFCKEIDNIGDKFTEKKIKLNVKEIYLGGGSPTYFKPEEFKKLVDKMKSSFDFSNIGDFTIEIDPRRVDEDRLLFYHECGVNRLSFGVQDFDETVQKRINNSLATRIIK